MHNLHEDADALFARVHSLDSIPKADLISWMRSPHIEVLAVIYNAISEAAIVRRIEPTLLSSEAEDFLRNYFERCLREDPDGKWANSRYSAAWDTAGWLKSSWSSLSEPDRTLWKEWITRLYRSSDAPTREAIETGLLEHVLSNKEIEIYFRDWQEEDELREAYRLSLSVAKAFRI